MKITPRRNKAMALASFIIVVVLVVLIIAGACYLCAKIQRFIQRINPPPPPDNPTFAPWLPPVNSASSADEGVIETPFGAITLPPGSPVTNSVVRFWIQSSTNLVDWLPVTNFYSTVDEIERVWMMPIDPSLPGQFFRIGAGEPSP